MVGAVPTTTGERPSMIILGLHDLTAAKGLCDSYLVGLLLSNVARRASSLDHVRRVFKWMSRPCGKLNYAGLQAQT